MSASLLSRQCKYLIPQKAFTDLYNSVLKYGTFLDNDAVLIFVCGAERNGNKKTARERFMQYAEKHHDKMAKKALEIFINIYGAKSRDVAYTFLPKGGLYIAGGIAPKILSHFINNKFIHAFNNKRYLSNMLEQIPITIILDTNVGLYGAENYAFKLARENNHVNHLHRNKAYKGICSNSKVILTNTIKYQL